MRKPSAISIRRRLRRWRTLDADLERRGVDLWIARANRPLRQLLTATGLMQRLGEEHIYPSVRAAVAAYRDRIWCGSAGNVLGKADIMLDEIRKGEHLTQYIPIVGWARSYQRSLAARRPGLGHRRRHGHGAGGDGLRPDGRGAAAGRSLCGHCGHGCLCAFATSRHLKVTTSSTMSIMSLAVVAPLAAGDAGTFMALSSALAITVGAIMLILGFLKLGFISDFLAKSVMTGYIFGVACLIAISQLPKVFGVSGGSGSFFEQLEQFIANLPETNLYSLALGIGTIVIILDQAFQAHDPRRAGGLDPGHCGILGVQAERTVRRRHRRRHPDRDDVPGHTADRPGQPSHSSSAARPASCSWRSARRWGRRAPLRRSIATRSTPIRSCWRWARRTSTRAFSRASRST